MIRSSDIRGLEIPNVAEAVKATLFADDTTVYLAEEDDFAVLQAILDKWCSASKAKFNIGKTIVLPLGLESHREQVISAYRREGRWKNYPIGATAAADGTPVRILGCFAGNRIDEMAIWTPKIRRLEEVMGRWKEHHSTLTGKRHAIQLFVAGMTQFLTEVQTMPDKITARLKGLIKDYLWEGKKTPPVSLEQTYRPWEQGGLDITDIEARNDAIQVTWLRAYLQDGKARPTWAW
ncbi:hypothetical protein PYCCODRAFT_1344228, partial [Trametes coccinea BRFM310]